MMRNNRIIGKLQNGLTMPTCDTHTHTPQTLYIAVVVPWLLVVLSYAQDTWVSTINLSGYFLPMICSKCKSAFLRKRGFSSKQVLYNLLSFR